MLQASAAKKGLGIAANVIQREPRCGSDSDAAPWVTAYSRTRIGWKEYCWRYRNADGRITSGKGADPELFLQETGSP